MTEVVLLWIAVAGLAGATVFLGLVVMAARRFQGLGAPVSAAAGKLPPVTMLKPLHGDEPRLRENLESFFRQNHPEFEIIFAARHADDPALGVVEQLRKQYPQVPVKVVLAGEPDRPNAKVCALIKMVELASHEFLVISDSDVHVEPGYLGKVVTPLLNPATGLVTCVYRGVSTGGVWSLLEALGMSIEMTSGVLVADMLEGMKFALGPTMATRKDVLRKIGGVEALAEFCSDDYVLGQLVEASGLEVVLSRHVIDHVVLNRTLRQSLQHQARWMKSTRFSRPMGHVGTGMTFAVPFGLLGLAAAWMAGRPGLGLLLLGLAVANRVVQALLVGWAALDDRDSLRYCWLYPVRDLLGFVLWANSFLNSRIVWRGQRYKLVAGGRMVALGQTGANPVPSRPLPTSFDRAS